MTKMSDYRVFQYDNYNELQQSELRYYVDEYSVARNREAFDVVKTALAKIGVEINMEMIQNEEENLYRLSIRVNPDSYLESNMRFAGPKIKGFRFPDNNYGLSGDYIHYSDVIFMMQNMSDKEIMNALNIKFATYYRHKKAMLDSDFYLMADKKRLSDPDYIKGEELRLYDNKF